jgi:hypothetical protein
MTDTLVFPVNIGTILPGYGRVSSVGFFVGSSKRYYCCTDKQGAGSWVPAEDVERAAGQEGGEHG